jgi:hypothetical protein
MRPEVIEQIASVIAERYPDFTPLHAAEKLWERHKLRVSREKVRRIMMVKGLWRRRRRRKEDHVWRERKPHPGEMVQLDGSHHAWLEERVPRLVLMGYMDDATGRFFGRFYDHEGVYPAMDSLRAVISSATDFPRLFIWINTALTRQLGSRRPRNSCETNRPRRSLKGRPWSWGLSSSIPTRRKPKAGSRGFSERFRTVWSKRCVERVLGPALRPIGSSIATCRSIISVS